MQVEVIQNDLTQQLAADRSVSHQQCAMDSAIITSMHGSALLIHLVKNMFHQLIYPEGKEYFNLTMRARSVQEAIPWQHCLEGEIL